MCGRYSLIHKPDELKKRFHVQRIEGTLLPRYNAAPAQQLALITNEQPRKIVLGEWGILPAWMQDAKTQRRLINARAETVQDKAMFREPIRKRRCLIIADGFYEWAQVPSKKHKQPFYIQRKDQAPFAMAGLYNQKKDAKKRAYLEFAIITVPANELLAHMHTRMPAMLLKKDEQTWLDVERPLTDAIKLLRNYPATLMQATPISLRVNNTNNDDPSVIAKVENVST